MSGWLAPETDPGPPELTPRYVQELSASAQAAELKGDKQLADMIHGEINASLDDMDKKK
jgi:hypothetical protein